MPKQLHAVHPPAPAPIPANMPVDELVRLAITRVEVGVRASERAADAAETTRDAVAEMKAIVQRQANATLASDARLGRLERDLRAARDGVPASWGARLALIGVAILLSVSASSGVVACALETRAHDLAAHR